MDQRFEMLAKLFEDEAFVKRIRGQSPDRVMQILKENYGLDFTLNELIEFSNAIQKAEELDDDGELNEENLVDVAGGGLFTFAPIALYWLIKNKKTRQTVIDFCHGFLDAM